LRIISGSARGLRLKSPQGQTIRPTSDRAREALFNIIGDHIQNATVLDLFAGTGALGLEALSRGAQHVTFVDKSHESINLIKKNLQTLEKALANDHERNRSLQHTEINISFPHQVSIFRYDLSKGIFFNMKERENTPSSYDIIFLDPPYAKGLSLQALRYLNKSSLLCEKALVVAEDTPTTNLSDTFDTLILTDKRRYGDTGFWLYKKK